MTSIIITLDRELTCGWSNKPVVQARTRMDFDITENNGCLPILGRSGHGKSTLLYVMACMAAPLRGGLAWRMDGKEYPHAEGHALLRRHFGFLMQDASLLPFLTIGESIRHMLRLRGITSELDSKTEAAISAMCIEGEQWEEIAGCYPSTLSGGQRHRMALAVAMSHDPAVLFADEPTGSLDDASRNEILANIKSWIENGNGKRAFVFVTHHKDEVETFGAKSCWNVNKENGHDVAGITEIQAGHLLPQN